MLNKKLLIIFLLLLFFSYNFYFIKSHTFIGRNKLNIEVFIFVFNNVRYDISNMEKFNGKMLLLYKNNQPKVIQTVKDGKRDGIKTMYYNSGKLEAEINFKNDILNGKTIIWYKNGIKKHIYNYKNNKLDGIISHYYSNGIHKKEGLYKNGQKNGQYLIWYENGKLESNTTFKNDKAVGIFKKYDKDGKLILMNKF